MDRRLFAKSLFTWPLLLTASTALSTIPKQKKLLIQSSPVAGFEYHQGKEIWKKLQINHKLRLVREKSNDYDERAVAVFWQQEKLGYVPRIENTAIAQMLDRNVSVTAKITCLQEDPNPWKRVLFSVYC